MKYLVKTRAQIMLFLAALIWGTNFVAQKSAAFSIPPFAFNGIRCLIGAFALFLISFFFKEKRRKKLRDLVEGGLMTGTFLFLGLGAQQAGIAYTTSGKAGFISSLYIVLVPIFSLFVGTKIKKSVWLGVFCAIFGMYFLCVNENFAIGKGDIVIFLSAVFFAFHIMCVSKYSKRTEAIKFSCLQFFFAGIFSAILSLLTETTTIIAIKNSTTELLYAGVLSCAVAYTLQVMGQKHVKPHIASLIFSSEAIFAALAGYLFLNEILSAREILGCVLMFFAVFLAQKKSKTKINSEEM